MAIPQTKPIALYPAFSELKSLDFGEYIDLKQFLESGESWWQNHWVWGREFLSYVGRDKSAHTFTRFRNETERFLLWVFLFKTKPMEQLRKADILEYADFCWQPPVAWICNANHEKFVFRNGHYTQNPLWAPFKLQLPKKRWKNSFRTKRSTSPLSKRSWQRSLPLLRSTST